MNTDFKKELMVETCATCYFYVHNDKFKSPIHKWYFATRNVTQVPLQATKLTNGTHEVCMFLACMPLKLGKFESPAF